MFTMFLECIILLRSFLKFQVKLVFVFLFLFEFNTTLMIKALRANSYTIKLFLEAYEILSRKAKEL